MPAPPESSLDDAPTRLRVAEFLLENGPATAAEIAAHLSLTATGIRRHLDHLVAEGHVSTRERRNLGQRGRGRPAREFTITDQGRGQFVHSYDEIAVSALQFLAEALGPEAVGEFAERRLNGLQTRLETLLADVRPAERPSILATALTAEGFAASSSATPNGAQMCQHHCPISQVAAQFPQLCEAEADMFARLLGTPVQRLATIAQGDGVCTTHLPLPHQNQHPQSPIPPAKAERI